MFNKHPLYGCDCCVSTYCWPYSAGYTYGRITITYRKLTEAELDIWQIPGFGLVSVDRNGKEQVLESFHPQKEAQKLCSPWEILKSLPTYISMRMGYTGDIHYLELFLLVIFIEDTTQVFACTVCKELLTRRIWTGLKCYSIMIPNKIFYHIWIHCVSQNISTYHLFSPKLPLAAPYLKLLTSKRRTEQAI